MPRPKRQVIEEHPRSLKAMTSRNPELRNRMKAWVAEYEGRYKSMEAWARGGCVSRPRRPTL